MAFFQISQEDSDAILIRSGRIRGGGIEVVGQRVVVVVLGALNAGC